MTTRHRTAQQVVRDLRKGKSSVDLEDIWVTFKSKKRSDLKFTKLPSNVKHKQIRSFRFGDGTIAWDKQDMKLDLLFTRNIRQMGKNISSSPNSRKSSHEGPQIQPQGQSQMDEEKQEVVDISKEEEPPGEGSKNNDDESFLTAHRPVHPVRGLKNLGNTCYYNSVVQNIVETLPLLDALEAEKGQDEYPISSALVRTVREMLKSEKNGKMFVPNQLLGAIAQTNKQFKGWRQQDSHELLRALLEGIRGDSKRADRDAKRKVVREKVSEWDEGIVSAWLSSINVDLDTEVEMSNEELIEVLSAKSLNLRNPVFLKMVKKLGIESSVPEPQKNKKKNEKKKKPTEGEDPSNEEKLLLALKLLRKGQCAFYKMQLEACESVDESVDTKDENDEIKERFRPKDVTDLVFGGVLESTVTCRTCSKVSSVHEWFHDLSLPIVAGGDYYEPQKRTQYISNKKRRKRNKKRRRKNQPYLTPPPSIKRKVVKEDPNARGEDRLRPGRITVETAFAAFTDSEVLNGDNSYGCENCSRMAMFTIHPEFFETKEDVGKVPSLEEETSLSPNVVDTTTEEISGDSKVDRNIPSEIKQEPGPNAVQFKNGYDQKSNNRDVSYDSKSLPGAEDSKALNATEPVTLSRTVPQPRGSEVEEKTQEERGAAKLNKSVPTVDVLTKTKEEDQAYINRVIADIAVWDEIAKGRGKPTEVMANSISKVSPTIKERSGLYMDLVKTQIDMFANGEVIGQGSNGNYRDPFVAMIGDQGLNVEDVNQCRTPSGSGDDSTDQNIPISKNELSYNLQLDAKNSPHIIETSIPKYDDDPIELFEANQQQPCSEQSSCGTLDEAIAAKVFCESKTAVWIDHLDPEYRELLKKYIENHQTSESPDRKPVDEIAPTKTDEQKDLTQLQIREIKQKQLFSDLRTKFNIQLHQTAELMLWFAAITATEPGNDDDNKNDDDYKDTLDGESIESSEIPTPATSAEPPPSIQIVKREADKALRIARPPKVLTVHLKRFQQNFNGRLTKTSKDVEFSRVLDITHYCTEEARSKYPMLYELFGLVVHSGSMAGGHYVAYVRKRPIRGTPAWYYFSDSVHKRLSSFQEVKKQQAYILFYQQVPSEVNE